MSSWNTVIKSKKSIGGKFHILNVFAEEITQKFEAYCEEFSYNDKITVSVREEVRLGTVWFLFR